MEIKELIKIIHKQISGIDIHRFNLADFQLIMCIIATIFTIGLFIYLIAMVINIHSLNRLCNNNDYKKYRDSLEVDKQYTIDNCKRVIFAMLIGIPVIAVGYSAWFSAL